MRALVSGSSGFIGRALVARLVGEGHEVHRLVRSSPGPSDAVIDVRARSIDASRLPGGGLESIDAVFHLAGAPITPSRWSVRRRELIRSSRVTTTHALARSLAGCAKPPPVLVSGSAIGIYGDRGEEELDEDSATGEGFLAEVCRAWEAATAPARDSGIRVVNARTGLVLGPGGGMLARQRPLFRAGLGARLGDGRQWNSWISLADETAALVHAATCPVLAGPCNLVAPTPVRNRELTDALAAALGRRAVLALPRPLLDLALGRTTAAELAFASQRVLPRRLVSSGFVHEHRQIGTALATAIAGPAAA